MAEKSYGHVNEGDCMTDGQKEYLFDTEAEDEGGDTMDNSDGASMRRVLRGLGEYRRFKAKFLAKHPERA